ncbi:hypothetical protein J2T60_001024 [Natronospira proteinivora]|uniref:Uncharacterized protein n=1 Tax=Natronospira proteinivora TaxID=1807133 RepID=A0ABT1G6Y3_9GAMM|nr:DUF3634 family protein [Natronospira proteinivora]MCP1727059.1 hypothetical protein [Natronospira proteinivora]
MTVKRAPSLIARLRGVVGMIRFSGGQVVETRGWVPAALLAGCRDIARLHRVQSGRVEVMGRGRRQYLNFSRDLPEGTRQAISNCWTPPPGDGGGGGARAAG